MRISDWSSDVCYSDLSKEPIKLDLQPTQHDRGLAPYFREFLRLEVSRLIDEGEVKPKEDGEKYDVYRDGLKIYTTINPRRQRYADRKRDVKGKRVTVSVDVGGRRSIKKKKKKKN